MNESYVDPTSKYYIDRMWEEYHKLKEELADTKSKLAQSEDYVNETLKPELAALQSSVKAWARGSNPGLRVIQELRAERDALRKVAAFFRSVILSGEKWSNHCQEMYDAALAERA